MKSPASLQLGRAEGLALLAVGLFALGFQLWLPSTHVDEADYAAVAKVLEAERQPGDVVLLAPWWTERARIFVPEGLPVVGYQGSDADGLERHPRIWVLSQPRQPRSGMGAFETAFNPGRTKVGEARVFGNLHLTLYQNGRARPVVLEAHAALASAHVYLEDANGQRNACEWNGTGHRCANRKTVAREWHEVHFAPFQCVRMDAPGGPIRQVVEFVAPGAGVLSVRAGYPWEWAAYKDGVTSSTLSVEIDGRATALELPAGVEAVHRLEAGAVQPGSRIRVALQADNPNARVVCVEATVFGGAP